MYLFDENISQHLVEFMKQFNMDVSHIDKEYGLSTLDADFLPKIGNRDIILVTIDYQMKSFVGKHGHGAILRENKIKALFLPKSFMIKPLGIPESSYPTVGWRQCVWIFRYWHEIHEQVSAMKNLSLAKISDRGKVDPI